MIVVSSTGWRTVFLWATVCLGFPDSRPSLSASQVVSYPAVGIQPVDEKRTQTTPPKAQDGKKPDDREKPVVADPQLLREAKEKRVNGVLLSVEPRVVQGKKYRLILDWTIDYSGPRWPLIILEPSVTRITSGQTAIVFFAEGKSGKLYDWVVQSPSQHPAVFPGFTAVKKEWFLRIEEKHKMDGGEIEIVPEDLRRHLLLHLPNEFDRAKPPKMYVRLAHTPSERVEELGFDPWVGNLLSTPKQFALPEW